MLVRCCCRHVVVVPRVRLGALQGPAKRPSIAVRRRNRPCDVCDGRNVANNFSSSLSEETRVICTADHFNLEQMLLG